MKKKDGEEYWNTQQDIEESEEETEPMMLDEKGDKRCYGSTRYIEDHRWLYFSRSFKG